MTSTKQLIKPKTTTKPPKLHNVIYHNDDKTTMDFVLQTLTANFALSEIEAYDKMMQVHERGSAPVATYTQEIAEFKANQVMALANRNGFPLKVTTEEES